MLVERGTQGDSTDFRALDLVLDRSNWQNMVVKAGAMPYFEDTVAFMTSYLALLIQGARRSRSQPLASGV